MTDTTEDERRDTGVARSSVRWDVVNRRCHELGADTDDARAALLGVHRRTIIRWRNGQTGIDLDTAMRVAGAISIRLDQLIKAGA